MHPTRLFKKPEELWELFQAYQHETKANPIRKQVFVGREGRKDYEERERPLTSSGFSVYCQQRRGCVEQYFKNQDGYYEDFIPICRAIKTIIRADQVEGGMANIYNPSITQRLNNLTEKVETKQPQSIQIIGISQEELDGILEE